MWNKRAQKSDFNNYPGKDTVASRSTRVGARIRKGRCALRNELGFYFPLSAHSLG